MVEQSTLLQVIQFVGLMAPALAILTELLVSFHGGLKQLRAEGEIPIEIQILFISIGALLVGGMIVGGQMLLTLDTRITQVAFLLVFGSLPFLALSIFTFQVRISSGSDRDLGLIGGYILQMKRASSFVFPLLASAMVFDILLSFSADAINSYFNWWIFQDFGETIWYFYGVAIFLTYKVMYSLWSTGYILSDDLAEVIEGWFVAFITYSVLFVVWTGPVFALYYALVVVLLPYFSITIPFVNTSSLLASLPFLWGGFVVFIALIDNLDLRD